MESKWHLQHGGRGWAPARVPAQRPQQERRAAPSEGGAGAGSEEGPERRGGAAAFLGAPRKEGRSRPAGPRRRSPGECLVSNSAGSGIGAGLAWVPAAGSGRRQPSNRSSEKEGAAAVEGTPGERKGP
uniref:Uncharacterized protein n=1 Tax=Rangifer tarandus platyrhynchus TaxID=3082113 RepID=A0ACB0DYZ8_RANTA|nr:unnamed protein product [Rangifer tarandus platyrhynchus]